MPATPSPLPLSRVYWVNADRHARARTAMHAELAKSKVTHVRVPAFDAQQDLAGNVLRAQTLSHLLLYERVHADRRKGQVVLVLEDTASFEYTPYWTTTLDAIVASAPADWGILQLAYRCDEPTIARVNRVMSAAEHISRPDNYAEMRVLLDDTGPYVEWTKWRPSLACAYLLHPRGYHALLKHARTPHFSPDAPPWEALFPHTRTYTYHVPLFTTRGGRDGYAPMRSLMLHRYPTEAEHNARERRDRVGQLVRAWYARWRRWHEAMARGGKGGE